MLTRQYYSSRHFRKMGGKQGSEIKEKREKEEERGKRIRVGEKKRCRNEEGERQNRKGEEQARGKKGTG